MGINLKRLKMYRLSQNLTQKNLASIVGINPVTYSAKEAGRSDFTAKEITKIASALNVSIEDLFSEKALF